MPAVTAQGERHFFHHSIRFIRQIAHLHYAWCGTKSFCRHEAVLCIAFLAALVSCFFVPPDSSYLAYMDWRTLALLYCLMVVVAGFCRAGLFQWLAHRLCRGAGNSRVIGAVLVGLCFFSSMLITNDVSLLTFVPFAVTVLGLAHKERELILVVVLQTVAANLGSMLTPVGNPQNLYLHSFYQMSNAAFFGATLPVWLVSLLALGALCFLLPTEKIEADLGEAPGLERSLLPLYSGLFLVCLLVVFRLVSWPWLLGLMILILACSPRERPMLVKADFLLLLTFVCFFIFAGNLARIETVSEALRQFLVGREYWTGVLASQIISNVPAALLLSPFCTKAQALLLGVDIGGLGTPVASLASLISLKLYLSVPGASWKRFLGAFTWINVLLLILLSLMFG